MLCVNSTVSVLFQRPIRRSGIPGDQLTCNAVCVLRAGRTGRNTVALKCLHDLVSFNCWISVADHQSNRECGEYWCAAVRQCWLVMGNNPYHVMSIRK